MHCACVETYEVGGCGLGCVCCGVRKENRPVNSVLLRMRASVDNNFVALVCSTVIQTIARQDWTKLEKYVSYKCVSLDYP